MHIWTRYFAASTARTLFSARVAFCLVAFNLCFALARSPENSACERTASLSRDSTPGLTSASFVLYRPMVRSRASSSQRFLTTPSRLAFCSSFSCVFCLLTLSSNSLRQVSFLNCEAELFAFSGGVGGGTLLSASPPYTAVDTLTAVTWPRSADAALQFAASLLAWTRGSPTPTGLTAVSGSPLRTGSDGSRSTLEAFVSSSSFDAAGPASETALISTVGASSSSIRYLIAPGHRSKKEKERES